MSEGNNKLESRKSIYFQKLENLLLIFMLYAVVDRSARFSSCDSALHLSILGESDGWTIY